MFDQLVAALQGKRTPARGIRAGDVFGRLTATAEVKLNEYGSKMTYCTCSCGGAKWVLQSHLKTGSVASCGCLRRERAIEVLHLARASASKKTVRGIDGKFKKLDN
jgi:hypothetical protein